MWPTWTTWSSIRMCVGGEDALCVRGQLARVCAQFERQVSDWAFISKRAVQVCAPFAWCAGRVCRCGGVACVQEELVKALEKAHEKVRFEMFAAPQGKAEGREHQPARRESKKCAVQ